MEIAANGRCEHCGETLQTDADACPACGAQLEDLPRRPRFTFAILVLLLIAGFAATGFIVRGFEARRQQLAERWFARGNRDLQSGAALQAISEFQTALAYSPDDNYRLKLAVALMQAGKWEEARAHLLNIWEQRPGDGEVNLLLARVFASRNSSASAIRYYQGAIYGVWETDPVGNREAARFELVDYLLSHGLKDAAQAELISLAAEAPAASADQLRLANLMLKADEPDRALEIFLQVRRKQHNNFEATLGAAEAQFRLLRFSSAAQLAKDALALNPASAQAAEIRNESDALVAADPRVRGIGSRERARRAFAAYQSANARLSACATSKPADAHLQQLINDQKSDFQKLKPLSLRDPDVRDQVIPWVFDVEISTAKLCGAPAGEDATMLKLAQAQESDH